MLKKILAGSTAGVLALTAMASTAMAADTIVLDAGSKTTKVEYVEFDLQGEINGLNLYKLLVNANAGNKIPEDADGKTVQNWDEFADSKNSYSNMLMGVWVNPTKTFWAMDANWKGVDFYNNNGNNTLLKQVNGQWVSNKDQLGNDVLTISNVEFSTSLDASVQKYEKDTANSTSTSVTYKKKGDPTSDSTTAKVTGGGTLVSATGSIGGVTTKPVDLQASFGLNSEKGLLSINFDETKSNVTVKFTVKLPYEVFRGLDKEQTSGINWDWNNPDWSLINNFFKGEKGTDLINDYFGIVGQSGTYDNENKNFNPVASVGARDVRVKMVSDIKTSEASKTVQNYFPNIATVPVGIGQNANLTALKEMNKGGKVTFEFDKDMKNQLVTNSVIFYSTSGAMALPLDAGFTWSEDGKTMSVGFPAGLTYSEQLNTYNSFKMEYRINDEVMSGVISGVNPPETDYDGSSKYGEHLIKITFSADGSSSNNGGNSGNNGGLVEDDKNKPATSDPASTPSTPSNSNNGGSSNNDNKNPSTGVAVAVAPAALAAVAAAVVISKKRK